MNSTGARLKAIMLTVIAVAAICMFYLIFYSISLSKKFDQVRLENEIFLSEKIQLNKILDGLKRDTSLAYEKNRELTRILETKQTRNEPIGNR